MEFINQVEPYLSGDEAKAVTEYLNSGGWLTEFRKTKEFEEMIADYIGVKHAIVITSGTVGLYLALLAHGVGKGDKVLVPNYTMIATINAVKWAGAEPVLVDVEPKTLCLDIGKIDLKQSYKAMLYVPINGRYGDMVEVVDFCIKHDIVLIEDACQAMGSVCKESKIGTFGDSAVFSFTPHKIITTGQGGVIVTNDDDIANKLRKLKDFHRTAPATDWHDGLGFNFKFTDLQAVIGIEQLKIIDFRVKRKREIYELYKKSLKGIVEIQMIDTDLNEMVPWFVDIYLESEATRNDLGVYLKKSGIGARNAYPPVNRQPMYAQDDNEYPISCDFAPRCLWLPSSIGLRDDQITMVCYFVLKFFRQ